MGKKTKIGERWSDTGIVARRRREGGQDPERASRGHTAAWILRLGVGKAAAKGRAGGGASRGPTAAWIRWIGMRKEAGRGRRRRG